MNQTKRSGRGFGKGGREKMTKEVLGPWTGQTYRTDDGLRDKRTHVLRPQAYKLVVQLLRQPRHVSLDRFAGAKTPVCVASGNPRMRLRQQGLEQRTPGNVAADAQRAQRGAVVGFLPRDELGALGLRRLLLEVVLAGHLQCCFHCFRT